jgi:RNA polymerase sigma factor (sigma-70 family)
VGDGFEAWYERQHPFVLSSLAVIAGSVDLAREAADEAFARAYERWERVAEMESSGGWVYQTALNVLRRRLRRSRKEFELLGGVAGGEAQVPDGWSVEVLDAVRGLPSRERTAVALRYVADLSTAEIAQAMGIASGTVGSTLYAARRRLAIALGDPDAIAVVELQEEPDAHA